MNACTSLCSAMRSARALSRPPFPTIIVRMRRCYVLGEQTGVALMRCLADDAGAPPDRPPQAPSEGAQQDPEAEQSAPHEPPVRSTPTVLVLEPGENAAHGGEPGEPPVCAGGDAQ